MGRLEGEVAIVTGSTAGGIGTAIARRFAAESAQVVITGRRRASGEAIARDTSETGSDCIFIHADLTVKDDCRALVDKAAEQLGSVTVVNNAVSDALSQDGTTIAISARRGSQD